MYCSLQASKSPCVVQAHNLPLCSQEGKCNQLDAWLFSVSITNLMLFRILCADIQCRPCLVHSYLWVADRQPHPCRLALFPAAQFVCKGIHRGSNCQLQSLCSDPMNVMKPTSKSTHCPQVKEPDHSWIELCCPHLS